MDKGIYVGRHVPRSWREITPEDQERAIRVVQAVIIIELEDGNIKMPEPGQWPILDNRLKPSKNAYARHLAVLTCEAAEYDAQGNICFYEELETDEDNFAVAASYYSDDGWEPGEEIPFDGGL